MKMMMIFIIHAIVAVLVTPFSNFSCCPPSPFVCMFLYIPLHCDIRLHLLRNKVLKKEVNSSSAARVRVRIMFLFSAVS